MKDDEFDVLIAKAKERSMPDCPIGLEANVLRRIRSSSVVAEESLSSWIFGLLPRPGFVFSMILLAISVSAAMTLVISKRLTNSSMNGAVASRALDFDVFQSETFFSLEDR